MKTRYVHHLVLLAYGPPRPSPSHVSMHADGTRTNNHESNLSWGTQRQNIHDAIVKGTHTASLRGEQSPNSRAARLIRAERRAAAARAGMGFVCNSL
jgi:hypothetical protein